MDAEDFVVPMAARPMEAKQPQREQSGSPPNWHGSTLVLKSAEGARGLREDALVGTGGRIEIFTQRGFSHVELRVVRTKMQELFDDIALVHRT